MHNVVCSIYVHGMCAMFNFSGYGNHANVKMV